MSNTSTNAEAKASTGHDAIRMTGFFVVEGSPPEAQERLRLLLGQFKWSKKRTSFVSGAGLRLSVPEPWPMAAKDGRPMSFKRELSKLVRGGVSFVTLSDGGNSIVKAQIERYADGKLVKTTTIDDIVEALAGLADYIP